METSVLTLDKTTVEFAELRPLLGRRAGGVETDREFACRILANDAEAVSFFLGEYSKPMLGYIAIDILHLKDVSDYGSAGDCILGEYYEFIAEPFPAECGCEPRWHKIALYEGRNGKRLHAYVGYITRNHFIRIKNKYAKKTEGSLLEFVDYATLLMCRGCDTEEDAHGQGAYDRLREAFGSLSEKDREVLQCLVLEKMHWTEAFEILRTHLDPLGPDKAWDGWSFEQKQRAIDACWTPKNRQDAMAGLKQRAIEHLARRYENLKKQGR